MSSRILFKSIPTGLTSGSDALTLNFVASETISRTQDRAIETPESLKDKKHNNEFSHPGSTKICYMAFGSKWLGLQQHTLFQTGEKLHTYTWQQHHSVVKHPPSHSLPHPMLHRQSTTFIFPPLLVACVANGNVPLTSNDEEMGQGGSPWPHFCSPLSRLEIKTIMCRKLDQETKVAFSQTKNTVN